MQNLQLYNWRSTMKLPCSSIIDGFSNIVRKYGNEDAVLFLGKKISYAKLDEDSSRMANVLYSLIGNAKTKFIGVCLKKSIKLITTILAILKCGAIYFPIDPMFVQEKRLKFLLDDTNCSVVVTNDELKSHFSFYKGELLCVEEKKKLFSQSPISRYHYNSTAYIMYSSGTLGFPKGILVQHKSVINVCKCYFDMSKLEPGDKHSMICSISFDVSILEIFASVLNGLCVFIVPENIRKNPIKFFSFLEIDRPDGCFVPPSLLRLIPRKRLSRRIKCFLVGGEASEVEAMKFWYNQVDIFLHGYGPTESCVMTNLKVWTINDDSGNIGKFIPNTFGYILNKDHLSLLPIGSEGEIFLGGIQLGRYWKNKSLNDQMYIKNPYNENEILYRTGDIGKLQKNGDIIFVGRINDEQVKVQGFRIEVKEIEQKLRSCDVVEDTIVIMVSYSLVAFVIQKDEKSVIGNERKVANVLKVYLGKHLPYFMIPAYFFLINVFPTNHSGKINKRKLISLAKSRIKFEKGKFNLGKGSLFLRIKSLWEDALLKKVKGEENLFSIGANSLHVINVYNQLPDEFKQTISLGEMYSNSSINSIVKLYMKKSHENINLNKDHVKVNKVVTSSQKNSNFAIVGMSVRTPGSTNLVEFWDLILKGKVCLQQYSAERFGFGKGDKFIPIGYPLKNIKRFDYNFFNIPKSVADIIDPQFRILLECCYHCLEDANFSWNDKEMFKKLGIFTTLGNSEYINFLDDSKSIVDKYNTFHMLGNFLSFHLKTSGPSIVVGDACSSSLSCLKIACDAINSGSCETALVGGISIHDIREKNGYTYKKGMIFSNNGLVSSFDQRASGTVFGSGVGVVLVKPLEKAIDDGDNIYAVIKGYAINSDGRREDRVNFFSPSSLGQSEVIRSALEMGNIDPSTIEYFETHSTGTKIGDSVEYESLMKVFGENIRRRTKFCRIGSLKQNIGHSDCAAGILGLIKSCLVLKYQQIPCLPLLNNLCDLFISRDSPFVFPKSTTIWKSSKSHPRRASVSSFGLGGGNVNVVLEEFMLENGNENIPKETNLNEVLLLSANSQSSLKEVLTNFKRLLKSDKEIELKDLSFSTKLREELQFRVFIVANSMNEAIVKLDSEDYIPRQIFSESKNIVLLFGGTSSEYENIGKNLFQNNHCFKNYIEKCCKIVKDECDLDFIANYFCGKENDSNYLENNLREKTLLLYVIEYSLGLISMQMGITPSVLIGLSLGEYAVVTLAGGMDFIDGVRILDYRAKIVSEKTQKGEMVCVFADYTTVVEILEELKRIDAKVEISLQVGEDVCVVSEFGFEGKLRKFLDEIELKYVKLKTNFCFHSSSMDVVTTSFEDYLKQFHFKKPKIPFYSSSEMVVVNEAISSNHWSRHLRNENCIVKGISKFLDDEGEVVFIECGSSQIKPLILRNFAGFNVQKHAVFSFLKGKKESSMESRLFFQCVGEIWQSGMKLNWKIFEKEMSKNRKKVKLPLYPFEQNNCWFSSKKMEGRQESMNFFGKGRSMSVLFPVKEIEHIVTSIIEGILRRNIARNENFFEAGIDSLSAIMIMTKIQTRFKTNISFKDIFTCNSIEGIINMLDNTINKRNVRSIQLKNTPLEKLECIPLSFSQQRLFILDKLIQCKEIYMFPVFLRMKGRLNLKIFKDAIYHTIKQNSSLRTCFRIKEKKSFQHVNEECDFYFEIFYCEGYSKSGRIECEDKYYKEILGRPFVLSEGPLVSVNILAFSSKDFSIIFNIHHIIIDFESYRIFFDCLCETYNTLKKGGILRKELINYDPQYYDFCIAQKKLLTDEICKLRHEFWKKKLSQFPLKLNLPFSKEQDSLKKRNFTASTYVHNIENDLFIKIKDFSVKNHVTLFVFHLSILFTVLFKYTKSNKLIVGVPFINRGSFSNAKNIIGLFMNMLPFPISLDGENTFLEVLELVKTTLFEIYDVVDYPFERIVEGIEVRRDINRNPVFQISFQYFNKKQRFTFDFDRIGTKVVRKDFPASKLDFSLIAYERENSVDLVFEFSNEFFITRSIKQFASHYTEIVRSVIENGKSIISSLKMLSNFELSQLIRSPKLKKFDDTTLPSSIFEKVVKRNPKSIAVEFLDKTLTYEELNISANQIAHCLRTEYKVTPINYVGICVEKSDFLIQSIIGVFKSGGIYFPLNDDLPSDRLKVLINQTKCTTLIISEKFKEKFSFFKGNVIVIEKKDFSKYNKNNPKNVNVLSDICYIIYTSGSSGSPKGSLIRQSSFVNFILCNKKDIFKLIDGDRITLLSNIVFDASIFELVLSLFNGLTIVVVPKEVIKNVRKLLPFLKEKRISASLIMPSILPLLVNYYDLNQLSTTFKILFVGGEICDRSCLNLWRNKFQVFNLYGPTETTVYVCRKEWNIGDSPNNIGKCISNVRHYVLDDKHNPVPIGVEGELYLGGICLSSGYLGMKEITERNFIDNPFIKNEKLYKTGDLCKKIRGGDILFIGRKDMQVKIRGFRIELKEIEYTLRAHEKVDGVVVLTHKSNIIAFVKCKEEGKVKISNSSLRKDILTHANSKLPRYMIPTLFVVDDFPLNVSNKVDAKKLIDEFERDIIWQEDEDFVLPKNEEEKNLLYLVCKVLNVSRICVTVNLFDYGLNSLRSILFMSLARENGIIFSLSDIYENPTIKGIAKIIRNVNEGTKTLSNYKVTKELFDVVPFQKLFLNSIDIDSSFCRYIVLDTSNVDLEIFKKSLKKLNEVNDIFKLRFVKYKNDDDIKQVYVNENMLRDFVEICYMEEYNEKSIQIMSNSEILEFEKNCKKNNVQKSLFRVIIYDCDEKSSTLLIFHKSFCDSSSISIILNELNTIYKSLKNDKIFMKKSPSHSLYQYCSFLHDFACGRKIFKEVSYWKENLVMEKKFCSILLKTLTPTVSNKMNAKLTSSPIIKILSIEQTNKFLNSIKNVRISINEAMMICIMNTFINVNGMPSNYVAVNNIINVHSKPFMGLDFEGNIGPYSSYYPVILTKENSSLGLNILSVKRQLRSIPNAGISFGVLKEKGAFGDENYNSVYHNLSYEHVGSYKSKLEIGKINAIKDIRISCYDGRGIFIHSYFFNDQFYYEISFNAKVFNEKKVIEIGNLLEENVNSLIQFCTNPKKYYTKNNNMSKFHQNVYHEIKNFVDFPFKVNEQVVYEIQPYGNKPPIFLIHAGGGFSSCYNEIAININDLSQPIFGINYPYFTDTRKNFQSFEKMCLFYISIMEDIFEKNKGRWKKRVWRLGGYSIGGNIAFEIVKQLQNKGETIDFLLLIDSFANEKDDIAFRDTVLYLENSEIPEMILFTSVISRLYLLFQNYNPNTSYVYNGNVIFIKSRDRKSSSNSNNSNGFNARFGGWEKYIKFENPEKVSLHFVDGSHTKLITSRNAKLFASAITSYLENQKEGK